MPTDTTALLRQLTVDRQSRPVRRFRPFAWGAAALVAATVAGSWFWLLREPVAPDIAATPEPLSCATGGTCRSGLPAAIAAPASSEDMAAGRPPLPGSDGAVADRVSLNATGYVVARRQATVSSKTTSRVVEVLIEEGLRVLEGQVLARLDDSNERAELALAAAQQAAAEAQVAELEAVLGNARQELARTRALARDNLASESLVDQRATEVDTLRARIERAHREIEVAARRVELQETRLADLTIRAPFDGVIIEKSVQPGEMISPVSAGGGFTRTGIGTIVDMESLEVEVDVNEAYINRVTVDQPVEITLNAYPDHTYQGRVLAVIPTADRSKATIRVRIGFAAVDAHVLPEMGIKAAFLHSA